MKSEEERNGMEGGGVRDQRRVETGGEGGVR